MFTSLRTLDVSYPHFPRSESDCHNNMIYWPFCQYTEFRDYFPLNLKELNAKMYSNPKFSSEGSSTRICLNGKLFNKPSRICISGALNILKKLDISLNFISYVQPSLAYPFTNITYLNVANNNLGTAIINGSYAKLLFRNFAYMEVLIAKNNNITVIHKGTFETIKNFKLLDLSENKLHTVDFKIEDLTSLEKADISMNKISYLDSTVCKKLESFGFDRRSRSDSVKEVGKINISLLHNPFTCSCEHIDFLKCLVELGQHGACFVKDTLLDIEDVSIRHFEYKSKESIVITIFSAFGVTTSLVTVIFIYLLAKEMKRRRQLQNKKEVWIKLNEIKNKKFPVFLSFSSEDDDFVMDYVYQNLNKGLQKALKTSSRCVAVGTIDLKLGHSIGNEIIRCMEECSVVMILLSNGFCRKPWCRFEVLTASTDHKPIILMTRDKVKTELIPKILRKHYATYTHVQWSMVDGKSVMSPRWEKLCKKIVRMIDTNSPP